MRRSIGRAATVWLVTGFLLLGGGAASALVLVATGVAGSDERVSDLEAQVRDLSREKERLSGVVSDLRAENRRLQAGRAQGLEGCGQAVDLALGAFRLMSQAFLRAADRGHVLSKALSDLDRGREELASAREEQADELMDEARAFERRARDREDQSMDARSACEPPAG